MQGTHNICRFEKMIFCINKIEQYMYIKQPLKQTKKHANKQIPNKQPNKLKERKNERKKKKTLFTCQAVCALQKIKS